MRVRTVVSMCVLLSACATAHTGSSSAASSRHDKNVITADEIASAHERTAYDVIKALRPGMLNTRGQTSITVQTAGPAIGDHGNTPAGPTEPANGPAGNNAIIVMMDGQRLGGVESLRRVVAEDLSEIRFLTPSQAQYRFGTGYPSGVIVVTSRTH